MIINERQNLMGIDNDDNDADINITSYKASLLVYGERERERRKS